MIPVALLVVAKAPVAGQAKTRLTPPLSPTAAADVAAAAAFEASLLGELGLLLLGGGQLRLCDSGGGCPCGECAFAA